MSCTTQIERPSIVEVVSSYTDLQRSGRELRGLCPFHAEKSPSFYVNPEKGLFHCFACGEGGDVFSFVQKAEGVDFRTAKKRLGITEAYRPDPERERARAVAKAIDKWAARTSVRVAGALRSLAPYRIEKADGPFFRAHVERERRMIAMLESIHDDLADPATSVELYKQREVIERLLELACPEVVITSVEDIFK